MDSLVTNRLSAEGHVTSARHSRDFTVNEITDVYGVTILSMSSEGQLLVGQYEDCQLHIYSVTGSRVQSVNVPCDVTLRDAVWTPRGNIVCTTKNNQKVIVMSRTGDVIKQTTGLFPNRLSVSADDVIYLADYKTGVYQSTDDGHTWSHVFNVSNDCHCVQVIKVSTNSSTDVFWTLEALTRDNNKSYLRVYTLDKRRSDAKNVKWRDVILPTHVAICLRYSRLAYDGHSNIFVTDETNRAVHVWSVTGQYEYQLHVHSKPNRPIVDCTRGHVMYVGLYRNIVGAFELTYEPN